MVGDPYSMNSNSADVLSKAGAIKPTIVDSYFNSHCIKVSDTSGQLLHTYGKEGNADKF